jgi:hypothetical protein
MWLRILIGGIVGGIVVFFVGFFTHAMLGLQGRAIANLPDEPRVAEALKSSGVKPGIYSLPGMLQGADASDPKKNEELNARYKAGPSGVIVIAPTGEDMMSGATLGMEFATNVIAALLAAWVVSLLAAEIGFMQRSLVVLALGVFSWFSLSASYGIWYRFPHAFIHDEFYCAALEWGLAGLAIAAIVRPAVGHQAPPR